MTTLVVRIAIVITFAVTGFSRATEPSVAIEIDPTMAGETSMAMWLGYLMARQAYRLEHNLPLPASGEIQPSFDEETSARAKAVQIYKELQEQDKNLHDAYWDTLIQVKAKGFMDAYVWTYLRRPEWPQNQQPKNLAAFEQWRTANLKNHKAITIGRLSVQTK